MTRRYLHGIFAHEDDTFTTKGDTDFVHLLRRDIVNGNDEAVQMSVQCLWLSLLYPTLTCILEEAP
jgi:hypothetical protein